MHEGSFTQQIVDSILMEVRKYPESRPRRILVRVGEMLHLIKESVRAHYAALAQGTALEGADLDLEEVEVTVRCCECGQVGGVEDHHLLICSVCESPNVIVEDGDTVTVDAIEFES